MRYSTTGRSSRTMVKSMLRLRFKSLIRKYVGFDVLAFRELMLDVGAVISGSSVTWMLSLCERSPGDLNIIVPRGQSQCLLHYFDELGYSRSTSEVDNIAYLATAYVYRLLRGNDQVVIVESKNKHVIHPVTCSLNSTQMNIMTPDEIIVFYPDLTLEGMAIIGRRCYPSNKHCHKVPQHFTVVDSSVFGQRCGKNCPAFYRRLYGIDGMARFNWAETRDERGTFEKYVLGCHHKWRLGSPCYNRVCPNSRNDIL